MTHNPLHKKTLVALSKLICDHAGADASNRQTWAFEFLLSANLPFVQPQAGIFCDEWIKERLSDYNQAPTQIETAILHIVNWSHFLDKPERFEPTLNHLQLILAPAGWTVEMDGISPYLRQISPSFRLQKTTTLPMEPTPEFSKINPDTVWVKVLRERWDEAERCIAANAPVMAIVALGSILEGALTATARRFQREAYQATKTPRDREGNTKRFVDWTFWNLVEVAEELSWIGAEVRRLAHFLRDYRNLVHPAQQVLSAEFPTQDSARTCRQAVLAALKSLIVYLENQAPAA